MRIILTCFGAVSILFLCILINLTIFSNNAHQIDTKNAMDNAIKKTANDYFIINEISSANEFEEEFISKYISELDSGYKNVCVEIDTSELDSGVVSVMVANTFMQINGMENTVTCKRTMILEEYTE